MDAGPIAGSHAGREAGVELTSWRLSSRPSWPEPSWQRPSWPGPSWQRPSSPEPSWQWPASQLSTGPWQRPSASIWCHGYRSRELLPLLEMLERASRGLFIPIALRPTTRNNKGDNDELYYGIDEQIRYQTIPFQPLREGRAATATLFGLVIMTT